MQRRIKAIRRALGLTQTEFGARIGVKGNTVTGYESGARGVSEASVTSICREFGVSEEWLREGRGDMFVVRSEDEALSRFFGQVVAEDGFRKRLLRALSQLDDTEWAALERLCQLVHREPEEEE